MTLLEESIKEVDGASSIAVQPPIIVSGKIVSFAQGLMGRRNKQQPDNNHYSWGDPSPDKQYVIFCFVLLMETTNDE